MSASQNLVGAGGVGLIAANFWLGGSREIVAGGTTNPSATAAQTDAAHKQLKVVAAELFFVVVATIIAGTSDTAGMAMLAVIVALAILWSIHHYAPAKTN